MQQYIDQLLTDITYATENVSWPFTEKKLELHDWMPDEEEDNTCEGRPEDANATALAGVGEHPVGAATDRPPDHK